MERASKNGWSVHGSTPQADLTDSQLEPSPLYLDPSSSFFYFSSFSYPTHLPLSTLSTFSGLLFYFLYLWMNPAWIFLVSSVWCASSLGGRPITLSCSISLLFSLFFFIFFFFSLDSVVTTAAVPNGCGTHETPIGASEKRRRVGLERYFFFFSLFLAFSLIFHFISVYPLLKPNPLHHLPPEGTEGSCNSNNFQWKLCRLFSDSSLLGISVVRQLKAKRHNTQLPNIIVEAFLFYGSFLRS